MVMMEIQPNSNPILPAPGVSRRAPEGEHRVQFHGQHDGPILNLSNEGRMVPENRLDPKAHQKTMKDKLLKCRKAVKISTMNVRSLREGWKAEELAEKCLLQDIQILGIQEHRIVHEDQDIRYSKLHGNVEMVTSSAWRNDAQAATGGVGLILSKRAAKLLVDVKSYGKRVLRATFQGNPTTTVIVAYSPTNVSSEQDIEKFYEELRAAVDSAPAHSFLTITGDFNARLGEQDALHPYHEITNRNGEFLAEFAREKELVITNTQFQKKRGKKWTWMSPAGEKYLIDYILVCKKWKNSVKNTEVYNTFSSIGSDHRIVTMEVRLSLRAPKSKTPARTQYDWRAFSERSELQDQYTLTVRNRFEALMVDRNPGTASEKYECFISANKTAMDKVVPKKVQGKRRAFSKHPDVIRAREEVEKAYKQIIKDTSESNRHELNLAKQGLRSAYDQLQEKELAEQIRGVQGSWGDQQHREAWKLINKVSGRKTRSVARIQGSTPEERLDNWHVHFKNLLGDEAVDNDSEEIDPVLEDLDIYDGLFTLQEFKEAKQQLQLGKSAGPDQIPPEVLKLCNLDSILLDMCNSSFMDRERVEQWSLMNIIPVFKSGNMLDPNNYRGISLAPVAAKLYNRLILNRIRPALEPFMRHNQNGFRPKRTTTAQVLALRRIIEEVRKNNLSSVMVFIDFKKAFDTINRQKMIRILTAYGIPTRIVQAISDMYSNTRARVQTPEGLTEEFQIMRGVLQGDTLAPYLFVIVLDYALRKAIGDDGNELGFTIKPRQSRRVHAQVITDLDFADDIALLSNEIKNAQELLNRVERECAVVGLRINAGKTKYITQNSRTEEVITTLTGEPLERVEDFKYLGSWVASTEKDIRVRKALAWKALHSLNNIWRTNLSRKIKLALFTASVESVLVYGSETWTLSQQNEQRLNGCYTRLLRQALNIKPGTHIRNEDLYQEIPPLSDKIRTRRMRLAGHCYRHVELSAQRLVLWEPTHGTKRRGGQQQTYVDTLRRDTDQTLTGDIGQCMQAREVWRSIIARGPHST